MAYHWMHGAEMRRIVKRALMAAGFAVVFLALESCSGNPRVSTGVGIHRSSSGNWGHSISIGVHSHGGRW